MADHASTGDASAHAGSRTTGAHTPGPWTVSAPVGTWIQTVGDPYGHGQMHVADVRGWGHLTGMGACALDEDPAIAIQTANAHLIAAAPELLAALKDCCAALGGTRHPDAIPASALAAIAKAEGR